MRQGLLYSNTEEAVSGPQYGTIAKDPIMAKGELWSKYSPEVFLIYLLYVHTYIHTYRYIQIHTYIHTYIHMRATIRPKDPIRAIYIICTESINESP